MTQFELKRSVLRRLLRAVLLAIRGGSSARRTAGSGGRGGSPRVLSVRIWHQQVVTLNLHLRPLGRIVVGVCETKR